MIVFDRKLRVFRDGDGSIIARSIVSGWGDAANDPEREDDKAIGPLPAGLYKMTGLVMKHPKLGPYVILLEQIEGKTFDRSAFRIHGANKTPSPLDDSHGCPIAGRAIRERCWAEPDKLFRVV